MKAEKSRMWKQRSALIDAERKTDMNEYTADDVLRLAKRVNNTKRNYLLVNPLQAKHMPVSPSASLKMMRTLGKMLAEKYPETRLIVGFAETATAIGAAVAECFPQDCFYMHTTRENLAHVKDWIIFQEEHSHATEQKLAQEGFLKGTKETDTILFIEDEISTGRTLRNMIPQLQGIMPGGSQKRMIAASIINRMSEENEKMLLYDGISCECLVRLPSEDYQDELNQISVDIAEKTQLVAEPALQSHQIDLTDLYSDPRRAVRTGSYAEMLKRIAENAIHQISKGFTKETNLLVLGTEECMYPALLFGEMLEKTIGCNVRCHATTRSPIGICGTPGYPIRNGQRMTSLYQNTRETFLYNLASYDAAIVVSDAEENVEQGLTELAETLHEYGTKKVFFLKLRGE